MVRRCAYDGDGGAPAVRALAASTACGRETALSVRDYTYHNFSNHSPSGDTIDYLFAAESSNGSASREIRFLYARPRMRDIFAAKLRLTRHFFKFGTRSRSSYKQTCWIGDVRSVFILFFCFLMFVYQAKINTVLLLPLPTKNSTVLHLPLPRRISTVDALKDPS